MYGARLIKIQKEKSKVSETYSKTKDAKETKLCHVSTEQEK